MVRYFFYGSPMFHYTTGGWLRVWAFMAFMLDKSWAAGPTNITRSDRNQGLYQPNPISDYIYNIYMYIYICIYDLPMLDHNFCKPNK